VNDLVTALAIKYAGDREVAKLYAEHHINSGNVETALETYKNVLNAASSLEDYKTIIEIEAYLERNDSVNRYAQLALERFPGDIDLYFTKGYGEYYMKSYDQSIATFQEALRYAPTDSLRSVIYGSMGEIARAGDSLNSEYAKYFQQALKFDPENLHAIYNYSDYLIQTGRDPERALKNLKNDSLRSLMLGTFGDMLHSLDGGADNRESYRYYQKALRYDPDNIHVLNNYSYFLSLEERELELALEMIGRVIELEPGNPTYIDTYGWILYKLGRYEEAKKALQQAVALDRDGSKELLIHYGDILYELGEYFMASTYWKRALDHGYDPQEIERRLKKIEDKQP
ncbi:MAG: tetratricopeptide repeat protein, partial [Rikenellaceae bacterium]|nr:tetratricopeptide repeat protein [Rikenellaceae bacterium]